MSEKIILKLEEVSKSFRQGDSEVNILSGVNLEVSEGETVAIIGASGCGKSTLLQIAGLLDSASSGEVYYANGLKASKLNGAKRDRFRLKYLGFVYQYHHLLRDFSAKENIAIPGLLTGAKFSSLLKKSDEFLEKMDLGHRRNNYPTQLSGGEQQRVAICRALFNNPKLLLADEPTGNLDPKTAEKVFAMMMQNVKQQNMAALIVTHNSSLAMQADRIFELSANGQLLRV